MVQRHFGSRFTIQNCSQEYPFFLNLIILLLSSHCHSDLKFDSHKSFCTRLLIDYTCNYFRFWWVQKGLSELFPQLKCTHIFHYFFKIKNPFKSLLLYRMVEFYSKMYVNILSETITF